MTIPTVLFVCTHNGARSRIAETFTRLAAPGRVDVCSASYDSGEIKALPVAVMKEVGVELPTAAPKSVYNRFRDKEVFDYVVKLCDAATTQECPVFLCTVDTLYEKAATSLTWSIPSFKSLGGTDEEKKAGARQIRDQIKAKVLELLSQLGIEPDSA
jgi:arsenate reductase